MTLYRFAVEELDFGRGVSTIPVADCGPGEEVQLDTGLAGWIQTDLFGHRRRFRAWIFTAALSWHRFVYPVYSETTETAIEACEAAWEHFGGVFKVVIPDNTKAIVDRADPLAPKLNRQPYDIPTWSRPKVARDQHARRQGPVLAAAALPGSIP